MARQNVDDRTIVPGVYTDSWIHDGDKGASIGSNPKLAISLESSNPEAIRDFYLEVSKGNIPGTSLSAVVARNPATTGTLLQDCWGGVGVMIYPVVNEAWEISSISASDTSAGVGARTVLVNYLDSDYLPKSVVVIMNGTTPVPVASDCFRPAGIFALTAGSSGSNVDKITLSQVGTGNVRNVMMPDIGRSHDTHFTVPAGKTAKFLTTLIIYPKDGSGVFRNRFRLKGANQAWNSGSVLPAYQNFIPFPFRSNPSIPSGTDLQLQVSADSGVLDVSVIFEFVLLDE